MRLSDAAFQLTFSRLFVYNILFEDAEVDERFLGVDETSRILAISGAGCGIAGHLSRRPRHVDATDINPHHLALTALKVTAAQHLAPYSRFYDLCGRGWSPEPERAIARLASHMPGWAQKHWAARSQLFARTIYQEGVTARMLGALRRMTGVDTEWLRWAARLPLEGRMAAIDEWIAPVLERPHVRALLTSPAQLVALGMNFTQTEKLMRTEAIDLVGFFVRHLKRLATTDLERNWFAWWGVGGQFNHDCADAVPPYLRADRHQRSLGAPTTIAYHRRNVFDVLEDAAPHTWTHYSFCDAPDWMSHEAQRHLLEEVRRTSRDGAVMLYRTVEDDCLVERHALSRSFVRMDAASDEGTKADRPRQYRRVHFYRVVH